MTPAEETLQQLERDIDSWHVERFRAQGTKVEVFENDEEVEFSIMHGSLFRRQTVVENGRFGFQSFWPVQSASAIYNREFGELPSAASSSRSKYQGGLAMSQPWQALEQLNDVATSHLSWRLLLGDAFDSHRELLVPIS